MSTAPTLAISATFTAEPLEDVLAFWCELLDRPARIAFAPFNQVFQQLLDPAGLRSRDAAGLNVVLVRLEDLGTDDELLGRAVHELIAAWHQATTITPTAPFLLAVCPSSAAMAHRRAAFDGFERRLSESVSALPASAALTSGELLQRYGVDEYEDREAAALGHVPYTDSFFAALGTHIARHWHALQPSPYKVIAADCDGTLWQGICGEVGPSGLVIDEPRQRLQHLLIERQQAGSLICLCSRNNEEDVARVFQERASDLPLTLGHVVSSRINWASKADNLRSLAAELNVGLNSFIFLDDDPVVCGEITQACPEVLTLQIPAVDLARFLDHLWLFDGRARTAEDSERTARYRQEADRTRARTAARGLREFFESLQLTVTFTPLDRAPLARVAQLTQRTNQFNTTTIRRSEAALAALMGENRLEGTVCEVTDRFGSYGLVGAMFYDIAGETLTVDSFLLSCRALGRGVEHAMLNRLGEIASARGCTTIRLLFRETGRNQPAQAFLKSLAAASPEDIDDGKAFTIAAREAEAARFEISAAEPMAMDETDTESSVAVSAAPSTAYQRIATDLTDAASIRRAIDATRRRTRPSRTDCVAPRTPLERQLVPLWADVLRLDRVGVTDDFFALGGHSLLATILVARMTRLLGRDLPLELLFEHPTIAATAAWIDEQHVALASNDELSALLDAVETLSDADAADLLAGQERP